MKTYSQSYGNAAYTVTDTLFSVFVQDDFQVRHELTINLGLRYELQTFTDSRKDFAPRAGFSYNVGGDGKTVIRGGFGIYYSQIVDNSEANYALTGPTGVFNFTASPGQIGFPSSVAAVPLPVFPAGGLVPLRSLYIRPGSLLLRPVLPYRHAGRLSERAVESLLRAVEHGRRAALARRLGAGHGLRRLAHPAASIALSTSTRLRPSYAPRPGRRAPRKPPIARAPIGSGGTARMARHVTRRPRPTRSRRIP